MLSLSSTIIQPVQNKYTQLQAAKDYVTATGSDE